MASPRIWFDPPSFSWGRVIRIGLLWLALVVAFTVPTPQPEQVAQAPVAASAVPMRRPASAPRRVATVAAPSSAPARVERAAPVADVAVCGGARVKLRSDGTPDLASSTAIDTPRVRQRIVSAIRRGGQEWDEASALFLELTASGRQGTANCEGGNCTGDPGRAAAGRSLEALARMALASRDPRIHMLAFNACGWSRQAQTGACKSVSIERWTQLDPNNAAPWMLLAAKAHHSRDAAGLADAMQRVAKATHSDSGWALLPGVVATHAPTEDAALPATLQLLTEAIGVQTTLSVPSYAPAMEFCRDDALRDAVRRQTCSEVAEVLATKSNTLIDRTMGATLGRRVGWPAERSDAMKSELDAIGQVMNTRVARGPDMLACEGARRSIGHYREVGQFGEVEAARRAIASDKPGVPARQQAAAYTASAPR